MSQAVMQESRYDRQERIWWWDQTKLRSARVLVVGAGALGNEVVKNLALVGVGFIDVVDMDRIEHSNLARCALFRDRDEGRLKAEALVDAAADINPDVELRAFSCRVQELGSAFLRGYDVIIGALDNREARLWVNQVARLWGMYWIDGAIEGLQGIVRVFGPEGPCYECTLGEVDRQMLSHRRSCALLAPEALVGGRTPTNATSASVIAALEVQEAIKILVERHELLALVGAAWRLEGETMLTSLVSYPEDPNCLAHDRVESVIDLETPAASLQHACEQVEKLTGEAVQTMYLLDDLIIVDPCEQCEDSQKVVGLRSVMPEGAGQCAVCGAEREIQAQSSIDRSEALLSEPLTAWLWPRSEVVAFRQDSAFHHAAVGGMS